MTLDELIEKLNDLRKQIPSCATAPVIATLSIDTHVPIVRYGGGVVIIGGAKARPPGW